MKKIIIFLHDKQQFYLLIFLNQFDLQVKLSFHYKFVCFFLFEITIPRALKISVRNDTHNEELVNLQPISQLLVSLSVMLGMFFSGNVFVCDTVCLSVCLSVHPHIHSKLSFLFIYFLVVFGGNIRVGWCAFLFLERISN